MAESLPLVTVIIATYNRPDVLRIAIQSVICQTFKDWRLLVIGDACSGTTAAVLDEFTHDPRVFYVNLKSRCGEQALPNSAGMRIAQTEYVAFLNHDDIWLPDHLQRALDVLTSKQADFFLGRAAYAFEVEALSGGGCRPVFSQVTPQNRRLRDAFCRGFLVFEPASSWVVRTSLARRTGAWRSAADLCRVPLQDWVLRAWRAGAIPVSDPHITCLKLEIHWGSSAAEQGYQSTAAGHVFLSKWLADTKPDDVRHALAAEIDTKASESWDRWDNIFLSKRKTARRMARLLRLPVMSAIYFHTGLDFYTLCCRVIGIPRGSLWRYSLTKRTGETLAKVPAMEMVVGELEENLSRDERWQCDGAF